MCGIVGYIGNKNAVPIIVEGLERLEYRGYDSAGIAIFDGSKIQMQKKIGKIENLKKVLKKHPLKGTLGIGHTRWATHGGVTDVNAHPHTNENTSITLIHNGIIENHQELREQLETKGVTFRSQTDTEVVAHLIAEKYDELQTGLQALGLTSSAQKNNCTILLEAVRKSLLQLEGAFSFVIMHKDFPQCLIAARLFSPLVLGFGKNENFVASDIPALLKHTKNIAHLEDNHVALIKQDSITVTDLQGNPQEITPRKVSYSLSTAEKGGHPHFLIKEIHESPKVIRNVFRGKISKKTNLNAKNLGLAHIDIEKIQKISLVACGTASFASLIGKYVFEKWANITTEVTTGSEFRYHDTVITPETLVIGVSQSGETADTLASLRKAKQAHPLGLIALTNVVGCSISRLVGEENTILLNAGPEISVASTKAFTAMITTLMLQALYIGQERGILSNKDFSTLLKELQNIPDKVEKLLKNKNHIAKIAMHYVNRNSMYYMGRGSNYPTALEGALKIKEISYIHAEGYAAGEMKHGPIAVLSEGFPVVAIATDSPIYKKMLSSIQEVTARHAEIIAVGNKGDSKLKKIATHIIEVPKTLDDFSPIINNIALQLFAYYTALYKGYSIDNPRSLSKSWPAPHKMKNIPKGLDIDKPRNLAKSVTVE